jgi:tetratricopeptide (TPR) repeat protein
LLLQSLALFRELETPLSCAEVLGNLSVTSMRAGDHTQALAYGRQSLKILKRLGNDDYAGLQHINLAEVFIESGELREALPELRAARRAFGSRPNRLYLAYYFEAAFKLAVELHAYDTAANIYGYTERLRHITRNPLQPNERATIESRLNRLKRALGTQVLDHLMANGALMDAASVEGLIDSLESTPKHVSQTR